MSKYKPNATKEEKEIIDLFFHGYTAKSIAKCLAKNHVVKSEKTKKDIQMPLKIATERVQKALMKIDWGGRKCREKKKATVPSLSALGSGLAISRN